MTTASDADLDREWVPNGRRPQSTVAQTFSQELMDIFRIDNSITDLDDQIDKRRKQVSTQANELESLEARIREMEKRLKQSKTEGEPDADAGAEARNAANQQTTPHRQRTGISLPSHSKERHGNAAPGGAMPPTPSASEDGGDE